VVNLLWQRHSAGVKSRIFPDPADPNTTGANYMFVLKLDLQAGKWTYIIQDTTPLTKNQWCINGYMFSSNSPVRAGMLVCFNKSDETVT